MDITTGAIKLNKTEQYILAQIDASHRQQLAIVCGGRIRNAGGGRRWGTRLINAARSLQSRGLVTLQYLGQFRDTKRFYTDLWTETLVRRLPS